jgi:hypothetical protein
VLRPKESIAESTLRALLSMRAAAIAPTETIGIAGTAIAGLRMISID